MGSGVVVSTEMVAVVADEPPALGDSQDITVEGVPMPTASAVACGCVTCSVRHVSAMSDTRHDVEAVRAAWERAANAPGLVPSGAHAAQ